MSLNLLLEPLLGTLLVSLPGLPQEQIQKRTPPNIVNIFVF